MRVLKTKGSEGIYHLHNSRPRLYLWINLQTR